METLSFSSSSLFFPFARPRQPFAIHWSRHEVSLSDDLYLRMLRVKVIRRKRSSSTACMANSAPSILHFSAFIFNMHRVLQVSHRKSLRHVNFMPVCCVWKLNPSPPGHHLDIHVQRRLILELELVHMAGANLSIPLTQEKFVTFCVDSESHIPYSRVIKRMRL